VNRGGATAQDVLTLMEDVNRIVKEKFGVGLEPEVRIIGE
jgi:UDP-N-acetylmuramate dehydrogenase